MVVLNRIEIGVFRCPRPFQKYGCFGRQQLLLNIGKVRQVEPLGKLRVEFIQMIIDELTHRKVEVPKRIGCAPIAALEGVCIGVAV
jgi:hypothetical protein